MEHRGSLPGLEVSVIGACDWPEGSAARHHNILHVIGVIICAHLGLTRALLPGRILIQNIVNIFHLSHFAVYPSIFSIAS